MEGEGMGDKSSLGSQTDGEGIQKILIEVMTKWKLLSLVTMRVLLEANLHVTYLLTNGTVYSNYMSLTR